MKVIKDTLLQLSLSDATKAAIEAVNNDSDFVEFFSKKKEEAKELSLAIISSGDPIKFLGVIITDSAELTDENLFSMARANLAGLIDDNNGIKVDENDEEIVNRVVNAIAVIAVYGINLRTLLSSDPAGADIAEKLEEFTRTVDMPVELAGELKVGPLFYKTLLELSNGSDFKFGSLYDIAFQNNMELMNNLSIACGEELRTSTVDEMLPKAVEIAKEYFDEYICDDEDLDDDEDDDEDYDDDWEEDDQEKDEYYDDDWSKD